jgi:fatty-acyl-CoA synthase
MLGLMMNMPLTISSLIRHADRHHGDTEIVSRTVEGPIHRYTYRDAHARARRIANALTRLGVKAGDRIGTLAWNGFRHLELYFGVTGMGAVIHTVNPRLFPDQIAYIVNHAEDSYVFFDLTFAPLIEKLAPHCKGVKGWVAMADRAHMPQQQIPGLLCYEDLLGAESAAFEWPEFDENTASGLCYTSGTTGNPKGVLYSHRSTVLHAYGAALPDGLNLSARDVVLPVVPMFHVNAWGLPYSCAAVGAKMVFPGAGLDGKSLHELFEAEGVTMTAGVPTVWLGLLAYMKQNNLRFGTVNRTVIGGSACPPAMIKTFEEDFGVHVLHAWGMTEMSPLGTACSFKAKHMKMSAEEQRKLQAKQGRVIYGVDMKIADGDGNALPHDGKAFGDLLVKGPWILREYYKGEGGNPLTADGWFPTGDVATIDPDGYIQITDRSKDVIKSGGEWISSIDLENIAVGHPAVAEAAVIGVRHPKWDERPLLIIVRKAGMDVTKEEMLKFYEGKTAKWSMPDDIVFVEQIPHTATGKLSKLTLRQQFADYKLPAG